MTLLSIIVLSYNTRDLTKRCLLSVINNYQEDIDKGKIELILADNGSSDGTIEEIRRIKFFRIRDSYARREIDLFRGTMEIVSQE